MIEIKLLSESDIPQVIQLSLRIFAPPKDVTDHFHQEQKWKEYYQENGLLLGAYNDGELAGYVFFYDREKDKQSSHCWLAGVLKNYRGKGILTSLMDAAQDLLKEKGYQSITINTYPEKFPAMYHYLTKYHFEMYHEEQREWQSHSTRKCFFRKAL